MFTDLHGIIEGSGDLHHPDNCLKLLGDKSQGIGAGIVGMVGGQQFISRLEPKRSQDGIHTVSGIGYERKVAGVGFQESG